MGRSSVQESFMSQAEVKWVIIFRLNYLHILSFVMIAQPQKTTQDLQTQSWWHDTIVSPQLCCSVSHVVELEAWVVRSLQNDQVVVSVRIYRVFLCHGLDLPCHGLELEPCTTHQIDHL